jgi:hypothetical protein
MNLRASSTGVNAFVLFRQAGRGGVGRQTYLACNAPPTVPRLIKVPRARKLI